MEHLYKDNTESKNLLVSLLPNVETSKLNTFSEALSEVDFFPCSDEIVGTLNEKLDAMHFDL